VEVPVVLQCWVLAHSCVVTGVAHELALHVCVWYVKHGSKTLAWEPSCCLALTHCGTTENAADSSNSQHQGRLHADKEEAYCNQCLKSAVELPRHA
jgi:hypothetical protein